MDEDRVILRTYKSIWRHDKKVYAIENIKLPTPIKPMELFSYGIGIAMVALICKVLPIATSIPWVFRYLLFPWLLMKFLTEKRFDGKLPHKFLISYIEYLSLPRIFSRFQAVENPAGIRFSPLVYRHFQTVNVTEAAMRRAEQHERKSKKIRFSDKIF